VTVFGSFLGLSYLLMSQVNALWHFYINYALIGGVGASIITVPVMATVSRWFIKKRGLMIGIVQAGLGIGGFVFSPFCGWLIVTHTWRTAYIVLGIITVAGMLISGSFLRRDPKDMGQLPDGTTLEIETKANEKLGSKLPGLPLWGAIRSSQFWLVTWICITIGFCRSTFNAHLAAHVQDLGFSLGDGARVMALVAGSSIIGRIGMGRLADIIGNRPALAISFIATASVLLWGLFSEHLWQLYIFALIFGFGWGAQAVLRFSITSEVFGLVSLGAVMGVLGLSESFAASLGAYLGGYIFDAVGDYLPLFWTGMVLCGLAVILTLRLRPAYNSAL
jgi:MFS family permease